MDELEAIAGRFQKAWNLTPGQVEDIVMIFRQRDLLYGSHLDEIKRLLADCLDALEEAGLWDDTRWKRAALYLEQHAPSSGITSPAPLIGTYYKSNG